MNIEVVKNFLMLLMGTIVTVAWGGSMVYGFFEPTHKTPSGLDAAFMAVLGYIFFRVTTGNNDGGQSESGSEDRAVRGGDRSGPAVSRDPSDPPAGSGSGTAAMEESPWYIHRGRRIGLGFAGC